METEQHTYYRARDASNEDNIILFMVKLGYGTLVCDLTACGECARDLGDCGGRRHATKTGKTGKTGLEEAAGRYGEVEGRGEAKNEERWGARTETSI